MKLACFMIFVYLNYSTRFSNDDFSSFNNSITRGETAKKWITNFKIKMSQDAQMFQAGAVTEFAAALLSFRYPSFTGKPGQTPLPLKSTQKGVTAGWCDILHQILEFFVAQCTLVKRGAVQSG